MLRLLLVTSALLLAVAMGTPFVSAQEEGTSDDGTSDDGSIQGQDPNGQFGTDPVGGGSGGGSYVNDTMACQGTPIDWTYDSSGNVTGVRCESAFCDMYVESEPDPRMVWWGTTSGVSYNPMEHWWVDGVRQDGALYSGQDLILANFGPGNHTIMAEAYPGEYIGKYCKAWAYGDSSSGQCIQQVNAYKSYVCSTGFPNSTSQPVCTGIATNPSTITEGESSTLSWSSTGATSASIDSGIGSVDTSGSRTVSPTANTTYTLTLSNSAGNTTCQAGVTVHKLSTVLDLASQNLGILGGGTSIRVGSSTRFTAQVKNEGAATGSGFQDTFFYSVNGGAFIAFSTVDKSALGMGAVSTDNSSGLILGSAGLVTIRHCVNTGDPRIEESETSNNCSDRTYTVTAPPEWPNPTCSVSPNPANVGQSVTWSSTVVGGTAPYAYQWSGAGLSNTSQSVTRSYGTAGEKVAELTVQDALGRSSTVVCPTLYVVDPDNPHPTAYIWASKDGGATWVPNALTIGPDSTVRLKWDSDNATSCIGDSHYSTGNATAGQKIPSDQPAVDSALLYRVTCTNGIDSNSDTVTVSRGASTTAPPSLEVDPTRVRQGETTHVTAILNGHTGCVITGRGINPGASDPTVRNIGNSNWSGSTDDIFGETTFRLACTSGGAAEATVYILPGLEHI